MRIDKAIRSWCCPPNMSVSGSSGGRDAVERMERVLAERRALLRRVEQRRLEGDDWAVVQALLWELIEQAKPGQESVRIELSEQKEPSGGRSGGR